MLSSLLDLSLKLARGEDRLPACELGCDVVAQRKGNVLSVFPLVCVAFLGQHSPLRRIGWPLLFVFAATLLVLGPWARSVWITSDIAQKRVISVE